jgi:hypothetical protein
MQYNLRPSSPARQHDVSALRTRKNRNRIETGALIKGVRTDASH